MGHTDHLDLDERADPRTIHQLFHSCVGQCRYAIHEWSADRPANRDEAVSAASGMYGPLNVIRYPFFLSNFNFRNENNHICQSDLFDCWKATEN